MRLNRLELTRYGHFTGRSLDFGETPPGGADLHVIYGANESGKSTLLNGWLDLLFGIPARSDMDFVHSYKTMQLAADLEIDGQVRTLVRVKANKAPLLDQQGNPVAEAVLRGGLRGLDRDAYRQMFSLNGQTLVDGGDSILASEGDLGRLLFSASAGLSGLSDGLERARAGIARFLSESGRSGDLTILKREFDELGEQRRALDTAAGEHAQLVRARDRAQADLNEATRRIEAMRTEAGQIDRMIGALPLAQRLRRLDAEIADFGALPSPPPAWIADLPELDRKQTESATRIDAAIAQVATLEQELDENVADPEALAQADAIAAAEAMKSEFETARKDLPNRLRDRDALDGAIAARLRRLGQEGADPETLLPQAGTLGSLRHLIETRSGIDAALAGAERELEQACQARDEADMQLRDSGGALTETEPLAALVARLRREDPQAATDRAREDLGKAQAALDTALTALHPWAGTAADLATVTRPDPARLESLRAEIAAAGRDLDRGRDLLARLKAELAKAEARAGSIGGGSGVTLEQAAAARAERERRWTRHRAALSAETADTFENAMRLDDQATAALAGERARAEKAAEASQAVAELQAELVTAQDAFAATRDRNERLGTELHRIVQAACPALPEDCDLDRLSAWLARHETACDRAEAADRAARGLAQAQARLDRATQELKQALAETGAAMPSDAGLAALIDRAQSVLDRSAAIAQMRKTLCIASREVDRRQAALDKTRQAAADWSDRWAKTCAGTWMAAADVSAMSAVLDELADLQEEVGKRRDLANRIGKMEDNRDRFAATVADIATALGLEPDLDPADAWAQISRRLRNAEDTERARERAADKLGKARAALEELQSDAALHRQKVQEIAGFFDQPDWPRAREALARAGQRTELTGQRTTLAGDLCERMQCGDTATALELLDGRDADALRARAQTLTADLDVLDADRREAHAAFKAAQADLDAVGGDDAVARIEARRQTLLVEIEDGARRYLRHRLGLAAVDHALRRYRDTHRSGMLNRASDAFRAMTGGRYSGLDAQPEDGREVLVAVAIDGGSKRAAQLSDGTRGQLYLALRIAGYHEFVHSNGPVPFVADDIMESFDDDRTAEAMRLMAETAQAGQVIYLTHHAHVCDIARAVCPETRLHRLDF